MIWVGKQLKFRRCHLLDKYEYLTDVDLGYKPNVFEKTKFEYSKLGPNKKHIIYILSKPD